MSRRFNCWSCKTAFLSDDPAGGPVVCPKCGTRQGPSTSGGLATSETSTSPTRATRAGTAEGSVFVPSDEARAREPHRARIVAGVAVAMLALVGAGVIAAWPSINKWLHPTPPPPPDPIASAASAYLKALADGDTAAAQRLGTFELPPAIRTYRNVRHDRTRDRPLKGSFAPIAAFHAKVDQTFDYDPAIGRFTPKNPLGPAAETLDAFHEAKAKAEESGLYKKMQSGDPDDQFDAAEGLGKMFTNLAEGVLAPKKLIPSYKQLVDDAKPPLPPTERELALDFGAHGPMWDALLKRPFFKLRSDGPFVLDRAEVSAQVVDALGSLGDPPKTLHLTLTRFRLEGIDTGWKVTATRREGEPAPTPPVEPAKTEPPRVSPGETYVSPGDRQGQAPN
jgi:hypothetical protein